MSDLILPDRSIAPPRPTLNIQIDAETLVRLLYEGFTKLAADTDKRIVELERRVNDIAPRLR